MTLIWILLTPSPKTRCAPSVLTGPVQEILAKVYKRVEIDHSHFFAFEIGFDPASPEATPRQVGFVWVCIGFELAFYWLLLALIGFVWVRIGFVLGSFFPRSPSVSLSYSLVIIVLTFI